MIPIRAIILDFDGLLVESNEEKTRAFEDLFGLYPAYREAMMPYHLANYSQPRRFKFEHYVYELMDQPGNINMLETMACQFSDLVMSRVVACSDVPGARAFLEEFSKQVPLYISSLTPLDELQKIIKKRRMASFFTAVFGNPPYRKSEAIEIVLTREKLSPSEVVLIGDSASDYYAATEAGVGFIGRDSGLPFIGIDVELYHDLFEIGNVVRQRLEG